MQKAPLKFPTLPPVRCLWAFRGQSAFPPQQERRNEYVWMTPN